MIILWCLILAATLLTPANVHVQAAIGSGTTIAPKCLREDSQKCVIAALTLTNQFDNVALPNLSGKTTLQIKRGNLATFSENLASQLGTVAKLQFGPLELKKIFLKPELLELTAGGNQIEEVEFQTVDAHFRLQFLDLSANRLTNLNGFGVLVNLRELHLEGNALQSIDFQVFNSMKYLEKLFLDRNQISTVKATQSLDLPLLEYMSLSGNQLEKFDVTNWQLDSLTKWDVSANKLVEIVGSPEDQFPSLQMISVAKNKWHCKWLEGTLGRFNKSLVQVQDRDEDCQGISPANICCEPEQTTDTANDEKLNDLMQLEIKSKHWEAEFESQLAKLKNDNEGKLKTLESRLKKVEELENRKKEDPTGETSNLKQAKFEPMANDVKNVEDALKQQQQLWKKQQIENDKIQRKLGYTILELKRCLGRDAKEIAEVQALLEQLRVHVSNTLEKRDRLMV